MTTAKKQQAFLEQSTDRAAEALARWAGANRKALGEMVTLASDTATEGVRLYGECQASALETVKASRTYWLRRVADLEDLQKQAV